MGLDRAWVLFLFPLALAALLFWRRRSSLGFPSLEIVPDSPAGRIFSWFFKAAPFLLLLLLALLAAGMTFPDRERLRYGYGADIVFILDESGSMQDPFTFSAGPDTLPHPEAGNKFSAAKTVIAKFMEQRKGGQERYGLTAFGTSAIRVLPLTFNHGLFLHCLRAQECILTSTVIYHPLALALEELLRSVARSRIIVFVSDGGGPVDDATYRFSDLVRSAGIHFYWICLGTEEFDEMTDFMARIGPLGKRIDASDPAQLAAGFAEIHRAERSVVLYTSSAPAFSSRPVVYAATVLMTLLWVAYCLLLHFPRIESP